MTRPGARAAGLLVVVLGLLLTGACGGEDESATGTIRVGYAFGTDGGDTGDMLAYEQLRKDGVTVDVSTTGGLENAVAALRRKSIDVAVLTQSSLVQALAQGADLAAIVGQNMTSESQLVARGPASVAELEGQQVAVGSGSSGSALVAFAARAAGLQGGAIRLRTVPESTARATALLGGRIEAAVLDASDVIRLRAELPDLEVLTRLSDDKSVTAPLVFATRPGFSERNGPLLRRFVAAILAASETLYGGEGRATFIRVAQAGALDGDSPELIGEIYDYYRSVGMWPRASQPITEALFRSTLDFYRENGQIESEVPFEQAWDLSFWNGD